MKNRLCLILIFLLLLTSSACSKQEKKEKINVTYITDTLGIDSKESKETIAGIKKGFENYDLNLYIITPESTDNYEEICNEATSSISTNLIISDTYTINSQLILSTAKIINDKESNIPNVAIIGNQDDTNSTMSLIFKEEEASFLSGVLAAKYSKTGVIGYIGGYSNQYVKYKSGFIAGAKTANPKIKIIVSTTGSYSSVEMGYNKAIEQIDQNADVIFAVCGGCTPGVGDACEQRNIKMISSDMYTYTNDQVNLATVDKNYENAAIYIAEAYSYSVDSKFTRAKYNCGLMEGVIDLDINEALVDEDIMSAINVYREDLSSYAPSIPKSDDELKGFKYSKALEDAKIENDPIYRRGTKENINNKQDKNKDKATDNKKKKK